jgi:hypothetical protein
MKKMENPGAAPSDEGGPPSIVFKTTSKLDPSQRAGRSISASAWLLGRPVPHTK